MSPSALETPMMKQFIKVKAQYPDAIIFYRMGDFYEMFLEDAELAAPLLDITLTARDKNKADAVPMCGIPVHSAEGHIKRLAELGHRIAICEQVEDPKQAGGKRLVRREVVEVVTPGLIGDPEGLDGRVVVALAALRVDPSGEVGIAVLDASTGEFRATQIEPETRSPGAGGTTTDSAVLSEMTVQELSRIAPRELLVEASLEESVRAELADLLPSVALTGIPATSFAPHPKAETWIQEIGAAQDLGAQAAVAVAQYLAENQPFATRNPPRLSRYEVAATVVLDSATRRHLELHENSEDRGRAGTLLAEIDETSCALGARRLSHWLAYPLLAPSAIEARQDAVAWLVAEDRSRGQLRNAMAKVRDLDRILSKAIRPGSVPRDLGTLRSSLAALPSVQDALAAGETAPQAALIGGAEGAAQEAQLSSAAEAMLNAARSLARAHGSLDPRAHRRSADHRQGISRRP